MLRPITNLRALKISLQALAVAAGAAMLVGCDDGGLAWAPLATGQQGVSSMTTDGSFVYWTTNKGAVRRVSIDGGPVETVIENLTNPDNVVVDGSHVYMTTQSGFVSRAAKAGGSEEPLFTDDQDVAGVRLDDTHVYWARKGGAVKRAVKAGGEPEVLAEDAAKSIASIAYAGASVFWSTNDNLGAVREVSASGGSVAEIHSGSVVRALATSDNRVAWATLDVEALAADPASNAVQISSAALDGGDVRVIARGLTSVDALVMNETHAFFSTLEGDVSAVSFDGGTPSVLSSGAKGKTRIALDATQVYWAREQGESVFVRPLPTEAVFQ